MGLLGRKSDETTRPAPASTSTRQEGTFIPQRSRRRGVESLFMRLIATGGIVGAGTALAAILGSQDVAAWIIGLAVSIVTVVLAAVLWSSRTL